MVADSSSRPSAATEEASQTIADHTSAGTSITRWTTLRSWVRRTGVLRMLGRWRGVRTKRELRRLWEAGGQTTDDHLMHVTGIAKDKDGKKFYLTKNSWGAVGPFGGYLFISENFMRAKLLAFMVHRGGLPKDCAAGASR